MAVAVIQPEGGMVGVEKSGRREIQDLLTAWARWRRIDSGANIGYASQTNFARHIKSTGSWLTKDALITDDMAGLVDRAVSRLRVRCSRGDHRYDVLTDYYILDMSDSAIGRRLRIDRRTVISARHAAESWVESHIDNELWNRNTINPCSVE